jgi:hypothetical protein
MKWAGNLANMGMKGITYIFVVEMFEGKRPLGRSESRWNNSTKIDLNDTRLHVMDYTGQDRNKSH